MPKPSDTKHSQNALTWIEPNTARTTQKHDKYF